MNAYVMLGGKRIKWARDSYSRVIDPVQIVQPTLQGTRMMSMGIHEHRWSIEAQFANSTDGTYATYADVQGWIEGTAAAQRVLAFQDVDGSVYTVLIANEPEFTPKSRDHTAAAALWVAKLELVKQ